MKKGNFKKLIEYFKRNEKKYVIMNAIKIIIVILQKIKPIEKC